MSAGCLFSIAPLHRRLGGGGDSTSAECWSSTPPHHAVEIEGERRLPLVPRRCRGQHLVGGSLR